MSDEKKDIEATPTPSLNPKQETKSYTLGEWWQAAKTVRPNDFRSIEKVPCARQSLMYGIAGGTAIGCTRYLTSNPLIASNWAVASFVIISAVSWRRCHSIQASQREQIQAIRDQLKEKARRKASETNDTGPKS